MRYQLRRVQRVPASRDEVAEFFEDPYNLEEITPPFLRFRIRTEGPVIMRTGEVIDYSLRLRGVPVRWRTRIEEYVPGTRFVDVQLRGPYVLWHHLHTFREVDGGTEVGDRVDYQLPWGPLGTFAHFLFVRRQLDEIFDFRSRKVTELFGKW